MLSMAYDINVEDRAIVVRSYTADDNKRTAVGFDRASVQECPPASMHPVQNMRRSERNSPQNFALFRLSVCTEKGIRRTVRIRRT